ncbi:MAG: hypothetical protein LBE82_05290 [Chitinophagaceae bacterium]|jgi:predicted glycosyltransferase involved in capsule biosynthesis|nr:hypothetical protein [Chitinophagaceae bacterium]
MYRKVFIAKNRENLMVRLPDEYLNKEVEVLAFELPDYEWKQIAKKEAAKEAVDFFKTIETDMSNFEFNRDEANER